MFLTWNPNVWIRTETYVVLLASTAPTLGPYFKKLSGLLSIVYRMVFNVSSKDEKTGAKTSKPAPYRTEAYATGGTKPSEEEQDSTDNILGAQGHGDIMMTTNIDISSTGSSIKSTGESVV